MSKKNKLNVYKRVNDNLRKKRKEATKILKKSKTVDVEIKILLTMIIVIVVMFSVSIVIALRRKKDRKNSVKVVDEGGNSDNSLNSNAQTNSFGNNSIGQMSSNAQINSLSSTNSFGNSQIQMNSNVQKIINDAGNILSDINHSEIFS